MNRLSLASRWSAIHVALLCCLAALPAYSADTLPWPLDVERQLAESRQDLRDAAQNAREAARDAVRHAHGDTLAATEHIEELVADALESAAVSIGHGSVKEIVKNAPFSADIVHETRQTLSDGNRIVRKSQSSFARDSMGRTRQQRGAKTVVIDDVVAGRAYLLHPDSRTAVRLPRLGGDVMRFAELASAASAPMAPPTPPLPSPPAAAPRASPGNTDVEVRPGRVVVQRKSGEPAEDVRVEVIRVEPGTVMAIPTVPTPTIAPTPPLPPLSLRGQPLAIPMTHGRGVTEPLAARDIEGVRAEGARTTYTVPAGAIGNERPIVTTAERLFSPELQVVVLATTNDPRSGETIYRLTNIKRGEPPAELFRIPPDVRMRGESRGR